MIYPRGRRSILLLQIPLVILFFSLSLAHSAAHETPAGERSEGDDIVIYRNEALGFQVSLPDSMRETGGDQSSVTLENEDSSMHLIIAIKDDLSWSEAENAGNDIETIGRTMLASAQRSHKVQELSGACCCYSGGNKAYKNVWRTTVTRKDGTPLPVQYLQLITINQGRLLLIQLVVMEGDFPAALAMMEKALETLTFYGKLAY